VAAFAVGLGSRINVVFYFFNGFFLEFCAFIHIAEFASVPGAIAVDAYEEAARLAWRADGTDVVTQSTHVILSADYTDLRRFLNRRLFPEFFFDHFEGYFVFLVKVSLHVCDYLFFYEGTKDRDADVKKTFLNAEKFAV
jgi:hypothetical protein